MSLPICQCIAMVDGFFQDGQAMHYIFLPGYVCVFGLVFVYLGKYVCVYIVCIDVFFQDGQAMRYIFLPGWTPSQLSSCLRGRLTWQLQQHSSAFLAGV